MATLDTDAAAQRASAVPVRAGMLPGRLHPVVVVAAIISLLLGFPVAARLAAERVAQRVIATQQQQMAESALAAGLTLPLDAPVLACIQADVAFHTVLYRLSGNRAIEDTVAAQWPHLKRSMGAVLDDPEQRPLVWTEHREILRCILAGDPAGAETARRLSQSSVSMGGVRKCR